MSSDVDDTAGLELSQDVLYGIAQLALDDVDGVRTITPPTRVGEFLTGRRAKGIVITRDGDAVSVALTVAMTYGERIPEVARAAQRAVREAVGSMTGMRVHTVDVFVEAVDVPIPAPGEPGAPVRALGSRAAAVARARTASRPASGERSRRDGPRKDDPESEPRG